MNKTDNKGKEVKIKHTVYLDKTEHADIIQGMIAMKKDARVISYYIAQALREKLRRDKFIPAKST